MITTRRALLQGGAALAAYTMLPASPILAATQTAATKATGSPLSLRAVKRTLEVKGRAAPVLGLEGPSGPGLTLDAGQRFQVHLTNGLDEPTLIHWHGQIPPNEQDGVPDMPLPALRGRAAVPRLPDAPPGNGARHPRDHDAPPGPQRGLARTRNRRGRPAVSGRAVEAP
ncbi:MAG: multicopper oxidase domain-containing protein, partial [Pannonibacter indicus]